MPKKVALANWIDRRIGGEVATTREFVGGAEQVLLSLRGEAPPELRDDRERSDRGDRGPGGKRKADRFFASLGEQLTPAEEELRDALLDIVVNAKDAPTIHTLKEQPGHEAVTAALEKVMKPEDRDIGLLLWMQRRIASDIEVLRITPSSDNCRSFCYFGLPGTLDEASLQRDCDERAAQGGGPKKRARHRSKGPTNGSADAGRAAPLPPPPPPSGLGER